MNISLAEDKKIHAIKSMPPLEFLRKSDGGLHQRDDSPALKWIGSNVDVQMWVWSIARNAGLIVWDDAAKAYVGNKDWTSEADSKHGFRSEGFRRKMEAKNKNKRKKRGRPTKWKQVSMDIMEMLAKSPLRSCDIISRLSWTTKPTIYVALKRLRSMDQIRYDEVTRVWISNVKGGNQPLTTDEFMLLTPEVFIGADITEDLQKDGYSLDSIKAALKEAVNTGLLQRNPLNNELTKTNPPAI